MKKVEYLGCVYCGVHKKMSEFSDCYHELDKLNMLDKLSPRIYKYIIGRKHSWSFLTKLFIEPTDTLNISFGE